MWWSIIFGALFVVVVIGGCLTIKNVKNTIYISTMALCIFAVLWSVLYFGIGSIVTNSVQKEIKGFRRTGLSSFDDGSFLISNDSYHYLIYNDGTYTMLSLNANDTILRYSTKTPSIITVVWGVNDASLEKWWYCKESVTNILTVPYNSVRYESEIIKISQILDK